MPPIYRRSRSSRGKKVPAPTSGLSVTDSTGDAIKEVQRPTVNACCGDHVTQKRTVDYGMTFFLIAWLWHIRVMPSFWGYGGRELMASLALLPDKVESFKEQHGLNNMEEGRYFAFMGAFTHTIVFLFGLVCASLLRRARLVVFDPKGPWPSPIRIMSSLALLIWITAIFHKLAWEFLKFCFETRYEPIFKFAVMFYNEKNGSTPFAWTSSVSYSAALFLGLILNVDEYSVELSQNKSALAHVRSWVAAIGIPFIVWVLTLDNVTLPFLGEMEIPLEIHDSNSFASTPSGKPIAFVLGMGMCCAMPTAWVALVSALQVGCRDEGVPRGGFWGEIFGCVWAVVKTFCVSLLISASFLTLALHDNFSVANLVFAIYTLVSVFAQLRFFLILFLLSATLGALVGAARWSEGARGATARDLFAAPEKPLLHGVPTWIKDQVAFWFIAYLWNCHLVGWWGSYMPHQIYAYVRRNYFGDDYSIGAAALDGWNIVFFGTYIPPVCVQALVKLGTAKLKAKWGIVQEMIIGAALTVPLSAMLYYYWVHDMPGLPVHILHTICHLFYILFTWNNRPEITGWRDWPAMRTWQGWELIQYYFDQQIIVEDEHGETVVNTYEPSKAAPDSPPWRRNRSNADYDEHEEGKPVPRIIGMSPHGILPCSLVWFPITPRWRSIFGNLHVCSLTDAFIHCIPFMREFVQWAGGLEVSKPNVVSKLKNGETIALIQGGQSEILLHSNENFAAKRSVSCDKHTGFCRVALEHGAELVPMYVFGELKSMQNINCAPLQRVTRKIIGFPFPFFPVGRYMLPFPIRTRFTFVFGRPLKGECATPGKPTNEEVKALHDQFFTELMRITEKHKEQAGHGDWEFLLRSQDDKEM